MRVWRSRSICPSKAATRNWKPFIWGGYKEKLKVRLVVESVPETVARKRLATLETYAKKHKDKKVCASRKAMCHFNVYVTNIPSSKLEVSKVRAAYSLRWQVELMFKTWKSHYHIDKNHKMNIFRFECYLYGRLIAILIDNSIQNIVREAFMQKEGVELSLLKASKQIKKSANLLAAILCGGAALRRWIRRLVKGLRKRAIKEAKTYKRKPPKPTAWEIIYSLS